MLIHDLQLVYRSDQRREKWISVCEASDLISKNGEAFQAILKLPVDEKLAYKVKIDLARTKMSEPPADDAWKSSLGNILTAFAQLDPESYYVQGMNFLAGELLEILTEEVRFLSTSPIPTSALGGIFCLNELRVLAINSARHSDRGFFFLLF